MIHLDGRIERLVDNNDDDVVDSWEVTNGVAGLNSVCRHIVYVGGKGCDTRTEAQIKSMENFVREFHDRYPDIQIVGHRDLASGKQCPSFDVKKWLQSIGINQ